MKKAILVFVGGVMIVACSSDPNVENLAIDAVKNSLLDPKSFKLIKTEPTDTFRLSNWVNMGLEHNQEMKDHYDETATEWSQLSYMKDMALEYRQKANKYTTKIDSLNNILNTTPDTVMSYSKTVRCYAANRLGTKGIQDVTVYFTPKFEVQSIEVKDIMEDNKVIRDKGELRELQYFELQIDTLLEVKE
jgi:hypothetical protein